jgi:hypothetical protein
MRSRFSANHFMPAGMDAVNRKLPQQQAGASDESQESTKKSPSSAEPMAGQGRPSRVDHIDAHPEQGGQEVTKNLEARRKWNPPPTPKFPLGRFPSTIHRSGTTGALADRRAEIFRRAGKTLRT